MEYGDGCSVVNLSATGRALGIDRQTVRAHVRKFVQLRLFKPQPRRNRVECKAYRVIGWKAYAKRYEIKRVRFVNIEPDLIYNPEKFRDAVILGRVEIARRSAKAKEKKKRSKRDTVNILDKATFRLSAAAIGAMFGKSVSWGSATRKRLTERGYLATKRIKEFAGKSSKGAKMLEALGMAVFWNQGKACFIVETIAEVTVLKHPYITYNRF